MKRFGRFPVILTVLIMFFSVSLSADDMMFQPAAVVNLVRPTMISMQELDEAYAEYRQTMLQQNQPVADGKEELLDILIENELLIQGARRYGIRVDQQEIQSVLNEQKQSLAQQMGQMSITDEQFVEILDQYFGKSIDGFKQDIENKLLVERYVLTAKRSMIENIPVPSEQEIRRIYRENATDFINPEFARIKHVFVNNRDKSDDDAYEKIRRAYRRLDAGEKTFSELVTEFSEDSSTRETDGEIGWISINDSGVRQMLGTAFIDNVFELSSGDVSGIIQSNAGYHIVKMEDHREARVLGLHDPINPATRTTVYEYIQSVVYQQKQAQVFNHAIDELVEELREEADIRILL